MDYDGKHGLSRRKVLSGLAVGAAAGVMVASPASATESHSGTDKNNGNGNGNGKRRQQFTLRCEDVRVDGDGGTFGELSDEGNNDAGSFWSAIATGSTATLTVHTFELPDATLFGAGSGPLEEATFAVLGGTGSLFGATGVYMARQDPVSNGGDGSGEFEFDLILPKE